MIFIIEDSIGFRVSKILGGESNPRQPFAWREIALSTIALTTLPHAIVFRLNNKHRRMDNSRLVLRSSENFALSGDVSLGGAPGRPRR